MPTESPFRDWCEQHVLAGARAGLRFRFSGQQMKEDLEKVGFEDIFVREYRVPTGVWHTDPDLRVIGEAQREVFTQDLGGQMNWLWFNTLKYSWKEIIVTAACVRKELAQSDATHYFFTLYGLALSYGFLANAYSFVVNGR